MIGQIIVYDKTHTKKSYGFSLSGVGVGTASFSQKEKKTHLPDASQYRQQIKGHVADGNSSASQHKTPHWLELPSGP